uniref:Uncharacterized protein n=1 Tax=Trichuris muris TaxID=70415 RepID=A0A5S6QJK9_TRIMR
MANAGLTLSTNAGTETEQNKLSVRQSAYQYPTTTADFGLLTRIVQLVSIQFGRSNQPMGATCFTPLLLSLSDDFWLGARAYRPIRRDSQSIFAFQWSS